MLIYKQCWADCHIMSLMMKWLAGLLSAIILSSLSLASVAYADSLRSPNYTVDESFVGGSGAIQSGSPNFKVDSSISDTANGNTASTNSAELIASMCMIEEGNAPNIILPAGPTTQPDDLALQCNRCRLLLCTGTSKLRVIRKTNHVESPPHQPGSSAFKVWGPGGAAFCPAEARSSRPQPAIQSAWYWAPLSELALPH